MFEATKATAPFHIFKHLVAECSSLPVESLHNVRLQAAYEMGEAVWMVADEMKLRANAPRRSKAARDMAVRVVAF